MDWRKFFSAVKKGVIDFFSDDEELEEEIAQEEEIEISLKGLFLFIALIIVLGLSVYGVRHYLEVKSGAAGQPPSQSVQTAGNPNQPQQTGQQPPANAQQPPQAGQQQATPPESAPPANPFTPEKIVALPPIDLLDVGAEGDDKYLDSAGFNVREPFPQFAEDNNFRWTHNQARFFFPFPGNKRYVTLDLLLSLPPNSKGTLTLTVNNKSYPSLALKRLGNHYLFPLDEKQLAVKYIDAVMNVADNQIEGGVQFLKARLMTAEDLAAFQAKATPAGGSSNEPASSAGGGAPQ